MATETVELDRVGLVKLLEYLKAVETVQQDKVNRLRVKIADSHALSNRLGEIERQRLMGHADALDSEIDLARHVIDALYDAGITLP